MNQQERVAEQAEGYMKAFEDGKPGKAAYHLVRMQEEAQVRHMFHLPTNNPSASLCGSATGLIRMIDTNVNCPKCLEALGKPQDVCCRPYPPATHTTVCHTVVHATHPWVDDDSGLTACGTLGPIDDKAPTCEVCRTHIDGMGGR